MSGVQKISYEIMKSLNSEKFDKYIMFGDFIDSGDRDYCLNKFEQIGARSILSKKLSRNIGIQDISAFMEIYKICKNEKFDIVHTHSTKPGIIGRIAARLAGVPNVIHTVHGIAFHNHEPFLKRVCYYLIEFFATFFSNNLILVNSYYKKYYKFFKNVTVIYNSIDYSELERTNKPNLSNEDKVINLLFVGRLDKQKDPITLITAFNILIKEYAINNCTLTMVGDGELATECADLITLYEINHLVKLEGWQSSVSKYYEMADVFCCSSIYESFGLMFLEAGYYKLPTVATQVEGIPEVIKDNETGLLVKSKDPQGFARALKTLIEDSSGRVAMGDRAFQHVTQKFSTIKMNEQYLAIYEQTSEL